MSKNNNVNPDHYKVAGRERQGEDVVHDDAKQHFNQSRTKHGDGSRNFIPGALPVGVSGKKKEKESAPDTADSPAAGKKVEQ